jgi:acyl-CoA thioester hydrolase
MTAEHPYVLSLRVVADDFDQLGHVNNVAFLRYVQDAAVAHWQAAAPSELQRQFLWVVRRHEIEYLKPGLPGDELAARTWVGEPAGARWDRFTEIVRAADGQVLVQARTEWVLLDAETGRPRRVTAEMVGMISRG